MSPENNNQLKITAFFQEEYQSLKGYVKSKIDDTTDRDAEDIIQEAAPSNFFKTGERVAHKQHTWVCLQYP